AAYNAEVRRHTTEGIGADSDVVNKSSTGAGRRRRWSSASQPNAVSVSVERSDAGGKRRRDIHPVGGINYSASGALNGQLLVHYRARCVYSNDNCIASHSGVYTVLERGDPSARHTNGLRW